MQYTLKKSLGQHFLNDAQVCKDIQAVLLAQPIEQLLEVGPGAGALTKYIQDIPKQSFKAIELDREKVAFRDSFITPLITLGGGVNAVGGTSNK